MGLVRLEKASNVARDLFSDYDHSQVAEAERVQKHTGENCLTDLCTTIFQKVMAAIFQDGGHENHFLDSFLQFSAILMILASNYIFLTIQNLNFRLRNSVKAYLTKYEIRIKIHYVG